MGHIKSDYLKSVGALCTTYLYNFYSVYLQSDLLCSLLLEICKITN